MDYFNNDLKFYPARLYRILGEDDNRLQVRILPLMEDYKDASLLPVFPPLFKNTVLNGYTEEKDTPAKADNLLVLSNSDFTFGWVVCKSNVFCTNSPDKSGSIEQQNINFEYVKKELKGVNIAGLLPDLSYENLVVQTLVFENSSDSHEKGGLIEFYNFKTGEKFIFHSSGSGIAITAHGVKLFAGEQNSTDTVKSGKYSYIQLEPGKLDIGCNTVHFESTLIEFGNGNRYLTGTLSSAASYAEGKDNLSIVDKTNQSVTLMA